MIQLADLFSVPEMGLICNVADYFERNHIDYHPEILFRDVRVSCFNLTKLCMKQIAFLCFRIQLEVPIRLCTKSSLKM